MIPDVAVRLAKPSLRVLYVTARFPWPLTTGFLRHYHLIRELSSRHSIHLLSLVGPDHHPDHVAALAPFTSGVQTIAPSPRRTWVQRKWERLRAWADPRRGDSTVQLLQDAVAARVRSQDFDAVFLAGKRLAPILEATGDRPVIADICDATSIRLRGHLRRAPFVRRPRLWLRWIEICRAERFLATHATHAVFASARDRDALADGTRMQRSSVVPTAVDLQYWRRHTPQLGRDTIVFSGAMSYPPNEDAALWLATRILPRVRQEWPAAELWIVGRDPRPHLRRCASLPGVHVTGFVDDLRPYLERAAVVAAPIRFGSGVQNKVLEALAMELPVVATALAAGGLRTEEGDEPPLEIATDAESFATALVARLEAAAHGAPSLAIARRYVEAHFTWSASAAKLDVILRRVAQSRIATIRS